MRLPLVTASLFAILRVAAQDDASPTSDAPAPQSTICGDIVNSGEFLFLASDAYACLTSVPFNGAVATRFLQYYNDTIQFHSTPAYLRNPPASYRQPAVDLFQRLDQLQQDVDDSVFPNQYAFEATLQNLIYSTHDAHLELVAGVLAAFTFVSPYGIVSVSTDGKELPKVYLTDDLIESQSGDFGWEASAIILINGQSTADYLPQFAALNAIGGLEPHADWNQLMSSPALDIQNSFSIFEGYTTFYPGDNITFTFENQTALTEPWLAIYNNPGDTGPLSTGGDFYNFFVLGLYPASYNPEEESESDSAVSLSEPTSAASTSDTSLLSTPTPTPTPTGWDNPAYPQIADVIQRDLGVGGVVTGYFLQDASIGVLSIPSFLAYGDSVADFSNVVTEFLQRSKEAGLKTILIDVQQNLGGNTLLAFDLFKQFFPNTELSASSRLRAHSIADILGNTFTTYFETQPLDYEDYSLLSASDWVATSLLNDETGENFTSWGEFFGPHPYNEDQFTTTQRYNLSSEVFARQASGGISIYGYGSRPAAAPQPFEAENVIILTDGICSSACAIFMEAMQHDGGVRSVVVGGQPTDGPMQAPSGTRGAEFYSIGDLDADFAVATFMNETAGALLPLRDEGIYVSYLGINIKDQIRENEKENENTPVQFLYSAADCRIFYTIYTFWNQTNLWKYAAAALSTNPEYCVTNSVGYGTTKPSTSAPPTVSPNINTNVSYNISGIIDMSSSAIDFPASFSGQQSAVDRQVPTTKAGQTCKDDAGCRGGAFQCKAVPSCGSISTRCVKTCTSANNTCGGFKCAIDKTTEGTVGGSKKKVHSGYCPLSGSDCRASSLTGPNSFQPSTVPTPKQGSAQRKDSVARDNLLAGDKLGSIVEAGLAAW